MVSIFVSFPESQCFQGVVPSPLRIQVSNDVDDWCVRMEREGTYVDLTFIEISEKILDSDIVVVFMEMPWVRAMSYNNNCQALVPSPVPLDPNPTPNQSKIKIQVQLGLGLTQ